MRTRHQTTTRVDATVQEILPSLGLAYLAGDDAHAWTVTKSTPGLGIARLQPGQRVRLTVERHGRFDVVSEYAELQ